MAMQGKPDNTDWDYEWSYLSGQLPQDERFIKSVTGNVYLTDEGLKFDGANGAISLVDYPRIMCYAKLSLFSLDATRDQGFYIAFFSLKREKEIICSGIKKVTSYGEIPTKYFGEFEFGKDFEILYNADLLDIYNTYVVCNGEKTETGTYKNMWFKGASQIGMSGLNGGYALLKELKFKKFDL